MDNYQEQRLYILRISSRLTATSAKVLFRRKLPQCRHLVLMQSGKWEQISIGKSTYVMCLCTRKLSSQIEEIIQFIVQSTDVTDYLVNDEDYTFKPKQIKEFNYVAFIKSYEEIYLENAPSDYARMMIKKRGDKSRYLDHKLLKSRGLEL